MYQVKVAQDAAKFIRKQDKHIQRRLINNIMALAENPRPHDSKKLTGFENTYRIRSGDYRIVYTIKDKILLVFVVRVAHREDVYRNL